MKVVIVGGGYGGSLVAKALDAEADVTLIDPREAFVNAAASLRALTRPNWAHHAFFPFTTLLARGRVIHQRAISADPTGVTLASGDRITADHLVLATGSSYPHPGKPHPSSTTVAQQLNDLHQTHEQLAKANTVQILGAGPVGLELAGEIKEVWPDKPVAVVSRSPELLPGFLPDVREDLHRQLKERGIELRRETGPATLCFQAFGVRMNTEYLKDGRLTPLTEQATIPVTEHLNVRGYEHVHAIGDIVDLPDPKMASYAMEHAAVVVDNIRGRRSVYTPTPERRILLPLGTSGGVGQLPTPNGPAPATPEAVYQRKGFDLFTAKFAARFSESAEAPVRHRAARTTPPGRSAASSGSDPAR